MNADMRFVLVVLASLALVGCSVNGDMTPMPDGPQTVKTVAFAGDTLVIPRPLLKIEVSGSWRNSDAA